jgi:hypothetical protein
MLRLPMNPPHPDANSTIQLDAIDALADLQLDDPFQGPYEAGGARGANPSSARPTPPPLPPITIAPPREEKPKRNTALYGAIFVVLLAAAIAGGAKLGLALRPAPPAVATPATAPSPAVAEPAPPVDPAASAAPAVLTIPTVELGGPTTKP